MKIIVETEQEAVSFSRLLIDIIKIIVKSETVIYRKIKENKYADT